MLCSWKVDYRTAKAIMMTSVIWRFTFDGGRHISCQGQSERKEQSMRVTREKAAENRERIVASAADLFREKGFDGVGVDAIMDGVGLTHGGFYRHFRSKDDLAAEAVAHGLAASVEKQSAYTSLSDLVAAYLSAAHRDDRSGGCMIAALGSDIARQGAGVRRGTTAYVRAHLDRISRWIGERSAADRRRQAIMTLSGIVGAMVLARAVDDPALSDEILAASRAAFGDRSRTGRPRSTAARASPARSSPDRTAPRRRP
jgi:TetR/AcrR family transcriptional repressor of nem operon